MNNSTQHIPPAPNFVPARILEVELSKPLPVISQIDDKNGQTYQRALIIVRLHTQIIGVIDIELTEDLSPTDLAKSIWQELENAINEHLQLDKLPSIEQLDINGLATSDKLFCKAERNALIEAGGSVSVVIASVSRTDMLADTIESLLQQDYPDFEIIIVDNAPHHATISKFIAENYAENSLIKCVSEANPGLAHAHNRGLAEVNNPFVVFTDDDVILDKHWLSEMVKGFHVSEDVACVTGMIFPFEMETPSQEWIEQYGGFNKGFSRRIFDLNSNRVDSPLYPYTAGVFGSGANMAFRTKVLREVKGFDSALGAGSVAMGGDDLAIFFAIIMTGNKIIYEPSALLYHKHRREYEGLRRQAYGYGVGLGAYLTATIINNPSLIFDFLSRVPTGLKYMFSSESSKNQGKQADYPKELTKIERRGLLYGPFAYLKSLWNIRSWERFID